MKILDALLGLFLWLLVIAGMVGASVAFGAILWALVR